MSRIGGGRGKKGGLKNEGGFLLDLFILEFTGDAGVQGSVFFSLVASHRRSRQIVIDLQLGRLTSRRVMGSPLIGHGFKG